MKKNITKKFLIIVGILFLTAVSTVFREFYDWWGVPNILFCVGCGAAISLVVNSK